MKTQSKTDIRVTSGANSSYWIDTAPAAKPHPLKENVETDVVIVGGGLAGLSVAYCLTQAGRKVVLVEDGLIGSGETGRTTAHLVTALDDRYYSLQKMHGDDKTRLFAESHKMAIDFVEGVVNTESIDCEFQRVNGYLFRHPTDKEDSLQKELEAAKESGIEIGAVDKAPGLLRNEKALCFFNQAQFHPMKYLAGLSKAIERDGGKIFTTTHAEEIDHEGVKTKDGFTIKANHVVIATNSPVTNDFRTFAKEYAYRTYVIGSLVKKDVLPKALWWDTGDFEINSSVPPYHYVRVQAYDAQHDLLISGGEDHPVGDTSNTDVPEDDRYALLEKWTRGFFPIEKVVYQWSGQVMEPMDGIAFIGRNPLDHDNMYIVTGDSGNGMTHCTFAGMLITDLILGKENPWEKLYRPSRFTLKAGTAIFKQMMHEFLTYLKHMPNFKSAEELTSVKKGEGKIVDMLEERFGVYRDEKDKLHIVSSECTHLSCTVRWNGDEKSWDCPCHGSRFTFEGKVMNGPANFDLIAYQETEDGVEKKEEKA